MTMLVRPAWLAWAMCVSQDFVWLEGAFLNVSQDILLESGFPVGALFTSGHEILCVECGVLVSRD